MSVLHLANGSPCPPTTPGLMRIYSMKYCPFAQLTRLALAHKNIPNEVVNIDLKRKPDWYKSKNPLMKVPCLELDGKLIYDSAICNRYLDNVYPQNKLYPSDPFESAQAEMLMERYISTVVGKLAPLLSKGGEADQVKEVQDALKYFEEVLSDGRKFFGGNTPNIVDIRFWPLSEKVEYAKERFGLDILPADSLPKLLAWYKNMKKTPAAIGGGMDLVNLSKLTTDADGFMNYDVGVTV